GRSFALLLDSARGAGPVYANDLPLSIWEQLASHGEVSTYLLGRAAPLTHAGQRPSAGLPRSSGVRLLGPILERLPAGTSALVLTNGPIHDLADFRSGWRERMVLVSTNPDYRDAWPPNTLNYGEGD